MTRSARSARAVAPVLRGAKFHPVGGYDGGFRRTEERRKEDKSEDKNFIDEINHI
jgi:hypothetical protein